MGAGGGTDIKTMALNFNMVWRLLLLSLYLSETDDPLYNLIGG